MRETIECKLICDEFSEIWRCQQLLCNLTLPFHTKSATFHYISREHLCAFHYRETLFCLSIVIGVVAVVFLGVSRLIKILAKLLQLTDDRYKESGR